MRKTMQRGVAAALRFDPGNVTGGRRRRVGFELLALGF
jgi:hypothetical protein